MWPVADSISSTANKWLRSASQEALKSLQLGQGFNYGGTVLYVTC